MNLQRLSVHDLEATERSVEQSLKKLEHRPRLTPPEQKLAAELKRVRLTVKDHLTNTNKR